MRHSATQNSKTAKKVQARAKKKVIDCESLRISSIDGVHERVF